jgi:hypothetical protein
MKRIILRGLALGAAIVFALGAATADADTLVIPMGRVDAGPKPVRLAAGDRVGRMIFAQHYRPAFEDAIPGRIAIFEADRLLPMEDWLRDWGAVQIQQIGRPY